MNFYLDVFAEDCMDSETVISMGILHAQERDRSRPCEDDVEATTELMNYLPEESDHEEGSPIDINSHEENHRLLTEAFIDFSIQEAYRIGS